AELQCNVLLAEDHPVNQEVALTMLEQLGCRVVVVENGQKAVDALSNGDYDVALMDCQMPEMDGFTATAEIRQRESAGGAHLPIIALTAGAMSGDREKCLAAGMDDYLTKPFTVDQLHGMLRRWLPQRTAAIEEAAAIAHAARSASSESTGRPSVDRAATAVDCAPLADPIDREAIDNICALGRPDLLDRIITLFCDDTPKLLDSMRHAAAEDDAK